MINKFIASGVVLGLLILFILASSIVQIIYGTKIKNNTITEKDKTAGTFIVVLGCFAILVSLVLGANAYFGDYKQVAIKILLGVLSLFIMASGIMQVVYGAKIRNNNIAEKDKHAGGYIMSLGIMSILTIFIIAGLAYYFYSLLTRFL
jgi:uncharacterized membrane protein